MKRLFIFLFACTLLVGISFTGQASAAQSGGNSASPLALAKNEAWVEDKGGNRIGYIFQTDGTFSALNNYDGQKVGEWVIKNKGTWKITGNKVRMETENGLVMDYTFAVSGNTLTLNFMGDVVKLTKTSGINPSGHIWGK
jgi:hypothetical protein